MTAGVYALTDPDTGEIRYIGRSANMSKRLHQHCKSFKSEKTNSARWVSKLASQGKKPNMVILEAHQNPIEIESKWIKWGKDNGFDLLNVMDGGFDDMRFYHSKDRSFLSVDGYRAPTRIYRDTFFRFAKPGRVAVKIMADLKAKMKSLKTMQDRIKFEMFIGNHICHNGLWGNKQKQEVWGWAHKIKPKVDKEYPGIMVIEYE
jgi:predicted GIY-YIG superfamily endonuclease